MLAVCKLAKGSTDNTSECPQNLQMRPREKMCLYVGWRKNEIKAKSGLPSHPEITFSKFASLPSS